MLNNEIGSSDTLEWKTLSHPARNITSLTSSGNDVTVVSDNEIVKNANEIYIHWNNNVRAGDILLIRTSTEETVRGYSTYISYVESVNFNYICCVGAVWIITEGKIAIGCIGNTWGLSNIPCGIAANSIRYR